MSYKSQHPSISLTRSATRRLMREASKLSCCPVVHASAAPLGEETLSEWHCTVIPQEGPYSGVAIHFILEIPPDYPNTAPYAFFHSDITYYGGANMKDANGRTAVCLDLFGNFSHLHTEWGKDGMASGWTNSYDISQILINVQAVMASGYLSPLPDAVKATLASGETACACGHCNSKIHPPMLSQEEALTKILDQTRLDAEKPPTIYCYSTKAEWSPETSDIFGYGISIKKGKYKTTYSTPAESLSFTAFRSGIRSGVMNQRFDEFLPIFINPRNWARIKDDVIDKVNVIIPGKTRPGLRLLQLLSALMNDLVVQVMSQPGVSANDKFIEGYFACYRMLVQLVTDAPYIFDWVEEQIEAFVSDVKNRNKKSVPDLGQWLIMLFVSKKFDWTAVSGAYLGESETRSVFWYAVGNRYNRPRYPALKAETPVPGRVKMVFDATKVSRDLLCFQTRFLSVVKAIDINVLDSRNGIIQDSVKSELKGMYKQIEAISNWDEWFEWNSLKSQSSSERETALITAVTNSRLSGYHK